MNGFEWLFCVIPLGLAAIVGFGAIYFAVASTDKWTEEPGYGFVMDRPQDDGCKYVNNGNDGGKQVEKWRERYGEQTCMKQ